MKKTLLFSVAAVAFAATAGAEPTDPIMLRTDSHGRTWQVDLAPGEPIVWEWTPKSTTATLTVTSYVSRATAEIYSFTRAENADTASFTLPPGGDGESLHDLVLEIYAGTRVVETRRARIVRLPQAFDVLVPASADWRQFSSRVPRPVPYDVAWSTNGAPVTLAVSGAAKSSAAVLPGESGYAPLDARGHLGGASGLLELSLDFNGAEGPSAIIERIPYGLVLQFN